MDEISELRTNDGLLVLAALDSPKAVAGFGE